MSCLYTVGENSALISNILDGGTDDTKNGRALIYARPYVLLEDGTYIYGDVVVVNLQQVVQAVDSKFDSLSVAQKEAITAMYAAFKQTMQIWDVPNLKKQLLAQ